MSDFNSRDEMRCAIQYFNDFINDDNYEDEYEHLNDDDSGYDSEDPNYDPQDEIKLGSEGVLLRGGRGNKPYPTFKHFLKTRPYQSRYLSRIVYESYKQSIKASLAGSDGELSCINCGESIDDGFAFCDKCRRQADKPSVDIEQMICPCCKNLVSSVDLVDSKYCDQCDCQVRQ